MEEDMVEEEDMEQDTEDYLNLDDNYSFDEDDTDMKTVANYSIMFYYTRDLSDTGLNMEDFIDGLLADTNLGYLNSQIPMRAFKHCMEMATIREDNYANIGSLLNAFKTMKGDSITEPCTKLRKSADVAVLLVNETSRCGGAKQSGFKGNNSFAVVKRSCALGRHSFGHEVAHTFGAQHNLEKGKRNKLFPEGHGHLIASVSVF